jgi:hypothetical protein
MWRNRKVSPAEAEVECTDPIPERRLDSSTAVSRPFGGSMIHDLVLSLVFLSMIIAPALVAIRADSDQPEY